MRIWHESLIPKLCRQHLLAMWREGLGCYSIIVNNKKGYRNHPAVKEFIGFIPILKNRLINVRNEMIKRNYNPKALPFSTDRWLGSVNVQTSVDEMPSAIEYKPWQTLEEQIAILKQKGCKCQL